MRRRVVSSNSENGSPMASGVGEPASSRQQQGPSSSSSSSAAAAAAAAANNNNDAGGNFECNICFEWAQDPIVTLCGHLYCWPCLYKWLRIHSHSPECPVCKAVIQEEKLVPLYGRGKTTSDPRTRSVPGEDIPHRPTGQRPETAPPSQPNAHPNPNQFPQPGFGFMGGFPPMATARWGNFTFSAGIGGLFPSLFNFHLHGFPDAGAYGAAAAPGFPYGMSNAFHGGHVHGYHHHHGNNSGLGQHADSHLTTLLAIVGVLVILALMWL